MRCNALKCWTAGALLVQDALFHESHAPSNNCTTARPLRCQVSCPHPIRAATVLHRQLCALPKCCLSSLPHLRLDASHLVDSLNPVRSDGHRQHKSRFSCMSHVSGHQRQKPQHAQQYTPTAAARCTTEAHSTLSARFARRGPSPRSPAAAHQHRQITYASALIPPAIESSLP